MGIYTDKRPTVPCGLCDRPTTSTATKRCDRCWELETRMRGDPILTRKIMDLMNRERKEL